MRTSHLIGLLLLACSVTAPAAAPSDPLDSSQWIYMARKFFKNAPLVFDNRVRVEAPAHAEDSLHTPVQVSAPTLAHVQRVLVFADLNQIIRVLDYYPVRAEPSIGFSFKIQQATPIRAAMRTADGVWHVGGTWIDAQGGGCTAPSVASNRPDLKTRLGKISARLWRLKHNRERLKLRIVHPMDTGLAAGIPRFYLSELTVADAHGDTLARIAPTEAVAENPVLTVEIDANGPIRLIGRDSDGNRFNARVAEPAS